MSHKCCVTASLWGKHTLRMCSHSRNVSVAWWKEHNPNPRWRHFYMRCFSLTPLSRTWSTSRSCVATRWMGRLFYFSFKFSWSYRCPPISPRRPHLHSSVHSLYYWTHPLLHPSSICTSTHPLLFSPSVGRQEKRSCSWETESNLQGITSPSTHSKPDSYYVLSGLSVLYQARFG